MTISPTQTVKLSLSMTASEKFSESLETISSGFNMNIIELSCLIRKSIKKHRYFKTEVNNFTTTE